MINIKKLTGHIPDSVLSRISDIQEITNDLRLAHFLSQCAHESANFTRTFENLNYSADGLIKTFPKYFTSDQAIQYSHDPISIGNRVYADRNGNRDEKSGDGYKYRGRGYIQLTGASNYDLFSKYIVIDCIDNPDLVATQYPLESAAWFFTKNNIWAKCDKGSELQNITEVTKAVNGGKHGLTSRIQLFNKFYNILVK
jgi:putative chitinase